jgi:alpha-ketoglutarate-dependent taurine dioxygenase
MPVALVLLLVPAAACLRVTESPSAGRSNLLSDVARAVEQAKVLQQSDPHAAIDQAAAAAAMLGKGRPRVREGKAPSARALLWAQAQTLLGAAYHTTIRHDEAAAAYARALGVLEAAPRGTRDGSGRPLEMEILAVKMERYGP